MDDAPAPTLYNVQCPHCRKPFTSEAIDGRAARYRGFKCPHCRLFVPFERVAQQESFQPDELEPAS
jgi:hypothetical protein